MTIRMHQWALPNTRTPNRGTKWRAATTVDGQLYEADSRNGAPNELARALVAAGIPDQPVRITHEGLRGDYSTGSLHEMAQWTYSESNSTLERVRWSPPSHRFAFVERIDKKGGETSSQVPDITSDLSVPVLLETSAVSDDATARRIEPPRWTASQRGR